MPKITNALLRYYEHDDRNELIRFTLHAYSQPSKSEKLRSELCLEPGEREEIGKKGMLEIRNEMVLYMEKMDSGAKFPIINALYANGVCCRNCMSVCHKIRYWEPLGTEQREKFVNRVMKWIQQKYGTTEEE